MKSIMLWSLLLFGSSPGEAGAGLSQMGCIKELFGRNFEKFIDDNGWVPRVTRNSQGKWIEIDGDFQTLVRYQDNYVAKVKLAKSPDQSIVKKNGKWIVDFHVVFEDVEGLFHYRMTGAVCGARNQYQLVKHYR